MTIIHGFELLRTQEIPELNTNARFFRHLQTGAELLSLENKDENKVFTITFRTPPEDSTGIAHIMEHSVLCGSKKYPLKEPFVELIKGSLNTFLNAFTYPDKTAYPVASQNLKDFYNLIDVYMDAVLHPLIPPTTLQQEGWHYELEDVNAPLTYKGVVFNEMKGAYSNPEDLLLDRARMSLFPDTIYRVDSGGDPQVIPDLTYAQFKDFHERYYHPSNARIYFYGDDDPDERLRLMNSYLSGYEKLEVDSSIALQPRFRMPLQLEQDFSAGESEEDRKGMLVMSWLLTETNDPELMLAFSILAHILIGTPASPLRKALIDSGLGEDLAGTGFEPELRQMYFSTGLKGLKADKDGNLPDAERVEELILKTLQALQQGIDREMVEASLNTIEFALRENNTGSFPQGLLLEMRSMTAWLYGHDPIAPLAFEEPLRTIKTQLSSGYRYFEAFLENFLLGNPHRTTLIMKPNPRWQKERDDEERLRLEKARAEMSPSELQQIVEQTQQLRELQQRPDPPEVLASLPSLTLDDLDKENKHIPLEETGLADVRTFTHDLFTNGILYLDLGLDVHTLPQELIPYVPLFGRALLEMGTEKEDYVRLAQRIGRSTGGIWPSPFTTLVQGSDQAAARLFIRSKATLDKVGELFSILEDVLLLPKLDNLERFRQMALEDKAGREAALVPAGHRIVNSRLRARFNEADWATEQMSGVSQLFFQRELIRQMETDWQSVLEKLEELHRHLVNRSALVVNVTLDDESWQGLKPQLTEFLQKLPSMPVAAASWAPPRNPLAEGLTIPAQVNYVGKGGNLFELGYQQDGSMDVIIKYLGTTWLWERVRVQGGAYGGFVSFSRRTGVLTYLSYRDPNLTGTLENFDRAADFLKGLKLDPAELTKSIIGAIGDMDAYLLPDAKGFLSLQRHLAGESDDFRQQVRDQLLSAKEQDFHALGELLGKMNKTADVVVMGSAEALAKANTELENKLAITKVI